MKDLYLLDEYASVINGGAWSENEYSHAGIKVVKATNMVNGTIAEMPMSYLPTSLYEKYKGHKLHKGDLVLATVGSHPNQPNSVVGKTATIPDRFEGAFLNQNAACIRVKDKTKVDSSFLRLLSRTILFKHHIESRARGSANQVRLAISELKKFAFEFPPLPIQRKIAAVLSAYDDLIENNNRRIAILEKMAEELYREWFVRLRFPGHEKVKLVKGVPEGWEVLDSLTLFDVMGGGTPKTDNQKYWDGEIPFFTPKDAHVGYFAERTEKNISQFGLENCSSRLFKRNTIFITARGTVGEIVLALRPMAMNQSCYALKPKQDKYIYYHFLALRNVVEIIKGKSNSGVFDNIITSSFKQFYLFQPEPKTLASFENLISPIIKKIEATVISNTFLSFSRDRLLSRLMSGKIDVEHLDIAFTRSMMEERVASRASATGTNSSATGENSLVTKARSPVTEALEVTMENH